MSDGDPKQTSPAATSSPDVSLVVPIYNQRSWLPGLLASIIGQLDPPRFEVIFCDDGSADDPVSVIAQETRGLAIDVRHVWQPDRGFRLARSKNNGIRCAAGKIIVFIDGDTWLAPTFLRDHWRAHEVSGRLVCGSRYTKFVEKLPAAWAWPPDNEAIVEPKNQRRWLGSPWEWASCFGGNFSVERAGCTLFDENFRSWGSEDRDFAFRLHRAGAEIFVLPEPNALQWKLAGTNWTDMPHEGVVEFLENKGYLAGKYPNGELSLSVNLVRRCHLSDAGQWSIGPTREGVNAVGVFQEFQQWKKSRDAS